MAGHASRQLHKLWNGPDDTNYVDGNDDVTN